MNKLKMNFTLIVVTLIISACGDKPQPPAPQAPSTQLFEQQRGVLEKAKGVEQTEAKSAEELKKEEEKQAR